MRLVLDNEAVQALMDQQHPKHVRVIAHLSAAVARKQGHQTPHIKVPATVMVEAGWNRSDRRLAELNRLHPQVDPLDEPRSRQCVQLLQLRRVGVVDAHVAALANSQTDRVTVLTSDRDDLEVLTDRHVTVVRI
ncbi:MAG: hypothetical protein FWH11_12770 [Micrococcales bacterium]|nr:hypothetical protein [Micrococcales bacterium]